MKTLSIKTMGHLLLLSLSFITNCFSASAADGDVHQTRKRRAETTLVQKAVVAKSAIKPSLLKKKGPRLVEPAKVIHHYDSPLKALIAPYIEQVVRIEFDGEYGDHMGTGFVFNAEAGVILTNHHVITSNAGRFKIILENGDQFHDDDVEILGLSPSQACGDFGFLRVKKMAGRFEQIPIVTEHSIKKRDPILFIGHSEESLSIEHGYVNQPYNFDMGKIAHAFQVQLNSRGGSSGSPTFNACGEINGLLFGGTDLHTTVLPICRVIDAYNMMIGGGSISPISFTSLGGHYTKVGIFDIAKYHHTVNAEDLLKYIPEKDKDEKNLLKFECSYTDSSGSVIEPGDILLRIDNKVVGCDTHIISSIIDDAESLTIEVLRRGDVISFPITPKIDTHSFSRMIDLGSFSICSSNSAMDGCSFKQNLPILMNRTMPIDDIEDEGDVSGIITHIDEHAVSSFNDAARAIHTVYAVQKREYLLFRVVNADAKPRDTVEVSLSALFGKDLYLTYFDIKTRQWRNTVLKKALKDRM